jgi:small-conductance mechanosensitive channel
MSNTLCTCNVCQTEVWPWSSEPTLVEPETNMHNIAMYPWAGNSNKDIPPDDPYQFEKYLQNHASPENKIEELSKALYHQIERTKYVTNTCTQMINDKVISDQIRNNMKHKIIELESKNVLLSKLLDDKNSHKQNLQSIQTDRNHRLQELYLECQHEISRKE